MKRRDFVIKSSLATGAIASSASALGHVFGSKNTEKNFKIGIIGTGDRGSGLIPIINDIPNFEVAACCDILPFRLENGLKKSNQNPKGYSDYRKLLEDKNLDAVLIATPFGTHSKIAQDAIDADKHVYCEKTLAKGYDGISQLVKKVRGSGLIFQTGHQYHSSRLYSHIVELIQTGKVGKIAAIESYWNRNGNWRRSVSDPQLERVINWRMYDELSGGLVAELCSHQLDFCNWALDGVPEKVMGMGGIDYWKDGRETYDNVHLMYLYPDGVKAKFTSLTSNANEDYKIKIMGDKGTLILNSAKAWFYPEEKYKKELGEVDGVSGATAAWEEGKGIPIEVVHADPSKDALMDFKTAVLQNERPISDVIAGAKAAICVQMGLDAMKKNEIITWPSEDYLKS